MKNSLRIHKWTHNEFNIFILGVLTHPLFLLRGFATCSARYEAERRIMSGHPGLDNLSGGIHRITVPQHHHCGALILCCCCFRST